MRRVIFAHSSHFPTDLHYIDDMLSFCTCLYPQQHAFYKEYFFLSCRYYCCCCLCLLVCYSLSLSLPQSLPLVVEEHVRLAAEHLQLHGLPHRLVRQIEPPPPTRRATLSLLLSLTLLLVLVLVLVLTHSECVVCV